MAFPDDRLPIRVELAFGADPAGDQAEWEWTDVTDDLHAQSIGISRGRSNEAAQVQPTSASLELDNPDGRYTPDHPMSPYWPYIDQGVPGRLSVQYGAPWLALDGDPASYAATPHTAALTPATSVDLRAEVTTDWMSDTSQALIGKWESTGDQRSYVLRINDGDLAFSWSTDGTLAGQLTWFRNLPYLPDRAAVRAAFEVATGTVQFYLAESLDGPWEEFGGPLTMGTATTIHPGTADLRVAPHDPTTTPGSRYPFAGKGHRFEVYADGVLVAAPDFTAQPLGTTAFTDTAGLDWTLAGAAQITNWHTRIVGQTDSWEPDWPYGDLSSATDDGESRVSVTISGLLRRLREGAKALDSTLRRRVPSGSPLAYWPLEEDREATQAYSPIEGVQPLATSGLEFAADSSMPGALQLPAVGSSGGSVSGRVPNTAADGWHVEMVYKLDELPATERQLLRVRVAGAGGGVAYAEVRISTAGIRVAAYDADDTLVAFVLYTDSGALADFTGVWNRLQFFTAESGSSTYLVVAWRDVIADTWWYARTIYTGGPGRVTGVSAEWHSDLQGMAFGHLAVFDVAGTYSPSTTLATPTVTIYDGADDAFTGETAGARMARLCAEEGIALQVVGYPFATAAMGPQQAATLLELLQECAAVDGGILGEQRERIGLRYRTRISLYNQNPAWELDAGANEITNPFRPVRDDSGTRNDVQVSRRGGSTARVVDEESVARRGRYEEQVTLNPAGDGQLPDIAAWRVHLGTWPGMRYPSVSAELAIAPQVIEDWLRLDSGDLIQVTGLPPQHPAGAVTLMAQGYTETLSPTRWTVRANCSPAGPWTVGVVEDEVLGRADTAGSELADPAGAADTVLYVTTTQGPAWVTDPSQFPFDLMVGGEVVTATACTEAAATPMPAAVDSDTVSAASAVAPSVDAPGTADLLICAWIPWDGVEAWTVPGAMSVQAQTTGEWSVLADATETLAAAGATGTRTATRTTSAPWAALSVVATGAPVVVEHLEGLASDATNSHAPGPVELTTSASTEAGWWLLALHAYDNDTAAPGPSGSGWSLLATTGSNGGSTATVGAWAKRATGGSETVAFQEGDADDNHARLYVISGAADLAAQAMTVTRSVNGVVKPHAAGTDVRLAHPAITSI